MKRDTEKAPVVYVLAGPNGAGKTTFANDFLPGFVDCLEFLNADSIAAGLSPFAPETQNLRAGRLMLERFNELVQQKRVFSFETTLSGRGYLRKLREMKRSGYRVVIFFLWLPSADLAVFRVSNRVRLGGHHVPENVIRRRYRTGIRNFFQFYESVADQWWLYDASQLPPVVIAQGDGDHLMLHDRKLFLHVKNKVRLSNHG